MTIAPVCGKDNENLKEKIKLIPAVSRVLIEYEEKYDKQKAREMFNYLVESIEKFFLKELTKETKNE